jgi:MFS family permease
MRYTFCVMLAFGGILAWLTTLPFLLQEVVKLTPIQFGWVSALAGLFFIVGGLLNALFVEKLSLEKMLTIGLIIMFLGSVLMLIFGLLGIIDTIVIIVPVIIYILGSSFIFSNAYAGAMQPFSQMAGTAAAIFGFLQILGGAISSALMSLAHTQNQIPLAIILLVSAALAFTIQRA